jgi:hypothetical protein
MNRKNKWPLLLLLLPALFILDSCKTKEKAVGKIALTSRAKEERIEILKSQAISYNTFSSALSLNFKTNAKNESTSLGAQLRIKKNEVIQLSFRVILGIEVAKVTITPEQIIIIDRINKRYLSEPMEKLRELAPVDFDFYSLQALLTNHLFIAGKPTIDSDDYDSFELTENEYVMSLMNTDSYGIKYNFMGDYTNRITQTEMYKNKDEVDMNWYYQNFDQVSNKRLFPMKMSMELKVPKDLIFLNLAFSNVEIDNSFNLDTGIPDKYQRINFQQVIKLLQSL